MPRTATRSAARERELSPVSLCLARGPNGPPTYDKVRLQARVPQDQGRAAAAETLRREELPGVLGDARAGAARRGAQGGDHGRAGEEQTVGAHADAVGLPGLAGLGDPVP